MGETRRKGVGGVAGNSIDVSVSVCLVCLCFCQGASRKNASKYRIEVSKENYRKKVITFERDEMMKTN